jgi:hypothetical protein
VGSSAARSRPEKITDARTSTGDAIPSRRAYFSDISTAAAAPSPIGEHINTVKGAETSRAARTCSRVTRSWNWALEFSAPKA